MIYASNGADDGGLELDEVGNGDFGEENNLESNLRRRKGKIMSCAKETIENGESVDFIYSYIYLVCHSERTNSMTIKNK